MLHSGIPRDTQSWCRKTVWQSNPGNSSQKLHYWNVVNMPYWKFFIVKKRANRHALRKITQVDCGPLTFKPPKSHWTPIDCYCYKFKQLNKIYFIGTRSAHYSLRPQNISSVNSTPSFDKNGSCGSLYKWMTTSQWKRYSIGVAFPFSQFHPQKK